MLNIPTTVRVNKGRSGWQARSLIPLGFDRRDIEVRTYKGGDGVLRSMLQVIQHHTDGLSYSFMVFQDYNRTLRQERTTATEAAVRRAHQSALALVAEHEAPIRAHYRQPAAEDPTPLLEAHTEADLRAKAQREDAARALEADALALTQQRMRADAEVAGFCLTGSNRPADVGAAHGQASLI